jgi:hypothetical protein
LWGTTWAAVILADSFTVVAAAAKAGADAASAIVATTSKNLFLFGLLIM